MIMIFLSILNDETRGTYVAGLKLFQQYYSDKRPISDPLGNVEA
jgi:hypothetical protein